jgi:transposase
LREPNRTERLPSWSLEEALPSDHVARTIWAYVSTVDLDGFLAGIKAVHGRPGRNATDPRVLLAVWMLATVDGVGSAREVADLCRAHLGYRWLCGGVTLNYHLLSDFRSDYRAELDGLLTDHIAALMHAGLVDMTRVAQDGMRVRAHAGGSSFRRQETIARLQQQVAQQIAQLTDQPADPPGAAAARSRAARARHLREKADRLARARQVAADLDAKRSGRRAEHPGEARGADPRRTAGRGSTTDPDARSMKMPDGGFRPGYNAQAAATTADGFILAVDVSSQGTDGGLMGLMIDRIEAAYGQRPTEVLVDGGFARAADVEAADRVVVYMPLRDEQKQLAAGKDPYQPKKGDGPRMAALRARMGTEEAKRVYRERAATAEWVNAGMRNRGLYRVLVRGLESVRAVVTMQAIVHNLLTMVRVCRQRQLPQRWTEILRTGLSGARSASTVETG